MRNQIGICCDKISRCRFLCTLSTITALLLVLLITNGCNREKGEKQTKIGIVIYSADAETVWNAFRFGNFALKQGDQVRAFLIAKGVECEKLDTEQFKITEQMKAYVNAGGKVFACGTCLKLRNYQGSDLCPLSTMKDMYDIIKEADKVLSF